MMLRALVVAVLGLLIVPGAVGYECDCRAGGGSPGCAEAGWGVNVRGHLIVPRGATALPRGAFQHCQELQFVDFGGSDVVTVGMEAFRNCPNLVSVTFSDSPVTTLERVAFFECPRLQHVDLRNSVVNTISPSGQVGSTGALPSCLGYGLAVAGTQRNDNAPRRRVECVPCGRLLDLRGSNVTSVGHGSFRCGATASSPRSGCDDVRVVHLGDVTAVGAESFMGCPNLESVHLGQATVLERDSFRGCSNLGSLHVDRPVTSVAGSAFFDTRCEPVLTDAASSGASMCGCNPSDQTCTMAPTPAPSSSAPATASPTTAPAPTPPVPTLAPTLAPTSSILTSTTAPTPAPGCQVQTDPCADLADEMQYCHDCLLNLTCARTCCELSCPPTASPSASPAPATASSTTAPAPTTPVPTRAPTLAPTTTALSQPPTLAPSTPGQASTRNHTGGSGHDSWVAIGAIVAVVLFLVVVGWKVRRDCDRDRDRDRQIEEYNHPAPMVVNVVYAALNPEGDPKQPAVPVDQYYASLDRSAPSYATLNPAGTYGQQQPAVPGDQDYASLGTPPSTGTVQSETLDDHTYEVLF